MLAGGQVALHRGALDDAVVLRVLERGRLAHAAVKQLHVDVVGIGVVQCHPDAAGIELMAERFLDRGAARIPLP